MSRFVTELLPTFLTSGLFVFYINKLQQFVSVIANSRLFMLVRKGELSLKVNGKRYWMEENSFLDVMETVTLASDHFSPDLRAWCLFVTFEFASESLKTLRPGPHRLLEQVNTPIKRFTDEECELLELQLQLLKGTLDNPTHFYKLELAHTYFRSFSLELGNLLLVHDENENLHPDSYFSKKDLITINFIKLVSKHFASEHRIDFYADALCVSAKHLTRILKEITGKSPHEIIRDEIIHLAMSMLEEEKKPVSQIAEELHFSDQAAFCKFFKKRMGISPMAYRRKEQMGLTDDEKAPE